jgi:hypothetical protein
MILPKCPTYTLYFEPDGSSICCAWLVAAGSFCAIAYRLAAKGYKFNIETGEMLWYTLLQVHFRKVVLVLRPSFLQIKCCPLLARSIYL